MPFGPLLVTHRKLGAGLKCRQPGAAGPLRGRIQAVLLGIQHKGIS